MKTLSFVSLICIYTLFLSACGGKTGNKEADMQGTDKSVNEKSGDNTTAPGASFLSANELLGLADYSDLAGVQLYMKDKAGSFVHARKGEFASLSTIAITDTAGRQIELTASTLYVSTDPMQDWRVAQTLHTEALSDELMADFSSKQFVLVDSTYSSEMKARRYFYESGQHPGIIMYYSKTYLPWSSKGIYVNRATWPCFVYEVYKANK